MYIKLMVYFLITRVLCFVKVPVTVVILFYIALWNMHADIVKVATCNNWTPHFSVIFVNADEVAKIIFHPSHKSLELSSNKLKTAKYVVKYI
jgi:hypothetical protein